MIRWYSDYFIRVGRSLLLQMTMDATDHRDNHGFHKAA